MSNYQKYEIVAHNPKAWFWCPKTNKPVEVTLLDCDFDKRVTMETSTGETINYKWGYVYDTESDCQKAIEYDWELDDYSDHPDCINPWKLMLSRKNYAMFKKMKRKENNKDGYRLWVNDLPSEEVKSLSKSLRKLKSINADTIDSVSLVSERDGLLFEFKNEEFTFYLTRDGKDRIKSRHIGKMETYKQLRK